MYRYRKLQIYTQLDGGLSGITTNPDTLLQYGLSPQMLAKLSSQTEKVIAFVSMKLQTHHHFSQAKASHKRNISNLRVNPLGFEVKNPMKVHNCLMITKEMLPEKIQNGILEIQNNAEKGLKEFVKELIWDKRQL